MNPSPYKVKTTSKADKEGELAHLETSSIYSSSTPGSRCNDGRTGGCPFLINSQDVSLEVSVSTVAALAVFALGCTMISFTGFTLKGFSCSPCLQF
jgi:hypothetical protein